MQIRGPGGQAWITANMRPVEGEEQDAAVEDAAHEAREDAREEIRTERRRHHQEQRRGGLGALLRRAGDVILNEQEGGEA